MITRLFKFKFIKIKYFILFYFIFISLLTSAQNNLLKLRQKLLSADSVLLVSHESPSLQSRNKMPLSEYKLIIKGRINERNIKERRLIKKNSIQYLSKIITQPFIDSVIERGMCFIPRHTIFIYKRNKISFIDICFQCQEFETSKDIQIPENDFNQQTWNKLELFFKKQGFKYGFQSD